MDLFVFFVDSLCVLKGFDSSLAHGRKYGFVGRDGLAKTTLLHDFIVKKNTK
jgi:ATPase subunit of ABC transporter with duplicated ATPase domains